MADEPKPILIFPENSQSDDKRASRKGGGGADLYDRQEQGKRFKSDFDTLRNTLERIKAGEGRMGVKAKEESAFTFWPHQK